MNGINNSDQPFIESDRKDTSFQPRTSLTSKTQAHDGNRLLKSYWNICYSSVLQFIIFIQCYIHTVYKCESCVTGNKELCFKFTQLILYCIFSNWKWPCSSSLLSSLRALSNTTLPQNFPRQKSWSNHVNQRSERSLLTHVIAEQMWSWFQKTKAGKQELPKLKSFHFAEPEPRNRSAETKTTGDLEFGAGLSNGENTCIFCWQMFFVRLYRYV